MSRKIEKKEVKELKAKKDTAFGKRLQKIRRQHKISQEDLGELLEVHFMTISRWERGVSQPNLEQLKILCVLFGVSSDVLIGLK